MIVNMHDNASIAGTWLIGNRRRKKVVTECWPSLRLIAWSHWSLFTFNCFGVNHSSTTNAIRFAASWESIFARWQCSSTCSINMPLNVTFRSGLIILSQQARAVCLFTLIRWSSVGGMSLTGFSSSKLAVTSTSAMACLSGSALDKEGALSSNPTNTSRSLTNVDIFFCLWGHESAISTKHSRICGQNDCSSDWRWVQSRSMNERMSQADRAACTNDGVKKSSVSGTCCTRRSYCIHLTKSLMRIMSKATYSTLSPTLLTIVRARRNSKSACTPIVWAP